MSPPWTNVNLASDTFAYSDKQFTSSKREQREHRRHVPILVIRCEGIYLRWVNLFSKWIGTLEGGRRRVLGRNWCRRDEVEFDKRIPVVAEQILLILNDVPIHLDVFQVFINSGSRQRNVFTYVFSF